MNQQGAGGSPVLHGGDHQGVTPTLSAAALARRLVDAQTTLDLPTDRPRPLSPSQKGALHTFSLPPALTRALADLCAAEGASPSLGLLATFAALLFRYSGSEQFTLGSPAPAWADDLPGLAEADPAGTLFLGVDLAGDPSLRELLRRLRAALADAAAQGACTFDQLAATLGPALEPGQLPFCQVLFEAESAPSGGRRGPLPRLHPLGWGGEGSADLALAFKARGAGLAGCFAYAVDLFDAPTIERLAGHFGALLAAALAAPDAPLAGLPLLGAAEHAQLAAWNQTATPLPLAPLHQLIAAQAARTPAAPALIAEGGQLSYAELDARANQLAHRLRELGVGPEQMVAVCMGRGSGLIVALLAVLKAGGAYLPLDPIYPPAHLAFMLADARPLVLLSDGPLPDGLFDALPPDAARPPLLDLTRDAAALAGLPAEAPPDLATLATLAYVIYTSGSTGRPKGVLIEHASAANYVLGCGLLYAVTPADRGLSFASVCFDASVDEIFVPLAHGAALVVTEGYAPPDFAALQGLVARHAITLLGLPTAYWHTWIAELEHSSASLPPSLRMVIIGGEAASGERYNRWRALVPPTVRLLNGYGPTETTVGSTWYVPSPEHDEPSGPMAIGRPLPNEQAYVLDRQLRPVPIGVLGELFIGGGGLARGYHNRPELTAERFVLVDGLAPDGPVRLYRTGDLVRWRADGALLYNGRADQQVKVRGYRIEPGEIEATLRKHPAVQAAAVVTRPDPAGELMLVGYVVPAAPGLAPAALRDFLKERLPHYMVPGALVLLDALPLTPSGKVDRRALPAPTVDEPEPGADDGAVRTHAEQVLTRIWHELLGRRAIGRDDDFFDLGGHSLLAMQMLVRVDSELGVKLPVSVLIRSSTIATLADEVTRQGGASPWSVLVPIQPAGERPPLFCVHGFPGDVLWFHDLGRRLGPDQPFYGLQSRSLQEGVAHATSIEQMAGWYLEGVRSVQPQGPYFICGASYGGIVALEMARQLKAEGEEVGLLAVLDYDPYAAPGGLADRLRGVADALAYLPDRLRNDLLPMTGAEFRGRLARRLRRALKGGLALLLGGARLPVDAADLMHYGARLPLHRRELLIANDYAFERYVPRPYAGKITLLATTSHYTLRAVTTGQTGWANLAEGGVEIVVVPGSHETMYRPPHVDALAASLRALIDAGRG